MQRNQQETLLSMSHPAIKNPLQLIANLISKKDLFNFRLVNKQFYAVANKALENLGIVFKFKKAKENEKYYGVVPINAGKQDMSYIIAKLNEASEFLLFNNKRAVMKYINPSSYHGKIYMIVKTNKNSLLKEDETFLPTGKEYWDRAGRHDVTERLTFFRVKPEEVRIQSLYTRSNKKLQFKAENQEDNKCVIF